MVIQLLRQGWERRGPGTVRHRVAATRERDSEKEGLGCSGRMLRLILEQLLSTSCQNTWDH